MNGSTPQSIFDGQLDSRGPYGEPTPPQNGPEEMLEPLSEDMVDLNTALRDLPQPDEIKPSSGSMITGETETSYVGVAHWEAILDSISMVRDYVEDQQERDQQAPQKGPALLVGQLDPITKDQAIAAVPEKSITDQLVLRYFTSMEAGVVVLHWPTFQKEYEAFWSNPQATSASWLSLLFGIAALGAFIFLRTEDDIADLDGEPAELVDMLRNRTAQCLILSNYTRPTAYTLESLLCYLKCEYVLSKDTYFPVSILLGIITQLAMRLGLHRDPIHFQHITVFHGEMRRRLWAVIAQLDVLVCFQMGLPRKIREDISDTLPPRNLVDDDLDPQMLALPPSRPETELTRVSYTIGKLRLASAFGVIADRAESTQPLQYELVKSMDGALTDAYLRIPPHLQVRSMDQSTLDKPDLIMQRFNLELLYQKARCVLHRPYLKESRFDVQYRYSQNACMSAALKLLEAQSTIFRQIKPGGLLHRDRWFISSLTTHDFILAAMIICMHLHYQMNESSSPISWDAYDRINAATECPASRETLTQALETSYCIWAEHKAQSSEAQKAYDVLSYILGKIKPSSIKPHPASTSVQPQYMDSMFDDGLGIDWGTWDKQLQDAATYDFLGQS
ncbi:MAG: hypothetical protein M4579_000371 [Chaenotheca gracillima]|nr:MAG: hypothetical protein M4579_000371 [Chaenotheca gracillima]